MGTEAFDEIVARLDTPMYIVTVAAEADSLAGCLVGFTAQTSIDPPRFSVFLSEKNRTREIAARTTCAVVHLLHHGDDAVARLFGEHTGDDVHKFATVPWTPGPDGCPVLEGLDWFGGPVVRRIDDDRDHMELVLAPEEGAAVRSREPVLGLQSVLDLDAGHPA